MANKPSAIVVNNWEDVACAVAIASRTGVSTLITFNPHVYSRVRRDVLSGEQFDVLLLDVPIEKDQYYHNATLAWEDSVEVDKLVANHLSTVLPEIANCCWLQFDLWRVFNTLRWYSKFWHSAIPSLKNWSISIPVRDIPQLHNIHSFLPGVILAECMKINGLEFTMWEYGGHEATPIVYPVLPSEENTQNFDVLAHIPTCISDHEFLSKEIIYTGKQCVQLPSLFWHKDINNASLGSLQAIDEPSLPFIEQGFAGVDVLLDGLERLLKGYLNKHISTDRYIDRQVKRIVISCASQVAFYFKTKQVFSRQRPKKIILSNYDVGYHGPIVSLARDFQIPILYFPHAKIFNFPVISPAGVNSACVCHPYQESVATAMDGRVVSCHSVVFPETIESVVESPRGLRKVGIILNSVSNNGFGVDMKIYIDGLRKLISWLRQRNVEFVIRARPDSPADLWLSEALGVNADQLSLWMQGTIKESISDCDICVMYDAVSSGLIELLRSAIPVIQLNIRFYFPFEISHQLCQLVPKGSCDEVIEMLNVFLRDPISLFEFKNKQFASYAVRVGDAHTLRSYI